MSEKKPEVDADAGGEFEPERMVIRMPNGTVLTVNPDGGVDVQGELDDDVIAIIHSLDPDAEIVCRPRPPSAPVL